MKLYSWNVNGLRAVWKKGFLDWMKAEGPDVVCLQETKSQPEQLDESQKSPLGYYGYFSSAEKKGYSGVATFSKVEPLNVETKMGVPEIDFEGRFLRTDYEGFSLINCYFPNSQREHGRLDYKLAFCSELHGYLDDLVSSGKNIVLCGDFNVAHKEIDLKNPKTNKNNAGFLPEERDWMTEFLENGYEDCFRKFDQSEGKYTWWSYRPGVREKNIGWRLDYHVTNKGFSENVLGAKIHPQVLGSDHCPVSIDIK